MNTIYFSEALKNILENKKGIIVVLVFLIISFTGIATTDSLIYSTSKKAEAELSLNGVNIITIDFEEKVSSKKMESLFIDSAFSLSMSKKTIYKIGKSPYSDDMKVIMGTDKSKISFKKINLTAPFEGNVILYSEDQFIDDPKNIYLNGIPFRTAGKILKKKTEFLDSLGLSSFSEKTNYIIPIETMFRLALDDSIDSIDLIKVNEISEKDLDLVKNILIKNDITKFTISSALDAKKTVKNVLDRFGLLTNSIYTILTVMMLIIIIMVCRRTFQSRRTEFALKVIHGIDRTVIIKTVIAEMIMINFLGLVLSIVLTVALTYTLSFILSLNLLFRPVMILFSFMLVIIASYVSGAQTGSKFFQQNPVELIKTRTL